MKLPISIDDVLRGKSIEWERLEYKKGWNPQAVLHTICAFANDFHNLGGGYIVIGVENRNGRPVLPPKGIDPDKIDDIQKAILELGHSSVRPMYHPLSTPCQVDGKWILVIWVPGGGTRPYKAKVSLSAQENEWAYYIRKQSSTVLARGADEQELIGLTATVPFDDRYNQQASVDDLSSHLIEQFLREVGSELADEVQSLDLESLGLQMNIVGGPSEAVFPKNVGLLFFNEDSRKFFPATQIDVVWFPDGAGGDRFDEKTFSGPISRMTREALDFIERNYLKETVVKHSDRAEAERLWNFPYAAVEEAVVNAVYHRSYEIREPVEVRITPEELVVLSFPGPDRSIKMQDLRAGRAVSRRYRNRRIGEFLKELDLAEGRSTGIPKILRNMKDNGSPAPVFESDEDRSYYLVRLSAHPKAGKVSEQVTPQVEAHDKAHDEAYEQMTDVENAVLDVCSKKPQATNDLLRALGYRTRTGNFKRAINHLLEIGYLKMTIPDKPRSKNQKYRLTQKGQDFLKKEMNNADNEH